MTSDFRASGELTGERYTHRHRPIVRTPSAPHTRCTFVLPSGTICDRPVNWVQTDIEWFRGEPRHNFGYWRHNPRPYRKH